VAAFGLAVRGGQVRAALSGLWPNAMAAFEQIGLADQVARLMRTTPRSVQLRQLDLVFALRTGRDDRQAPL